VFAGGEAEVTLDSIAKDAGVGIGTLYRHFPTREALVEATYRNELARLCDAADDLLATMPADQATRQWMDGFIGYMTTKRGMADALRAVVASGGDPFAESLARLVGAITTLLGAGAAAGTIRADVQPRDVLASLSGVSLAAGEPGQRDQARRMLDLLMDGLRYQGLPQPRSRSPSGSKGQRASWPNQRTICPVPAAPEPLCREPA
jgi:AcrR family transcriptional regulator